MIRRRCITLYAMHMSMGAFQIVVFLSLMFVNCQTNSAAKNTRQSHVIWQCTYHIVFCPKYRFRVLSCIVKELVDHDLRMLCEWKGCAVVYPCCFTLCNYPLITFFFECCLPATRASTEKHFCCDFVCVQKY